MANKKIDINRCTVEDLEQLPGIGRFKAEAIVKQRKAIRGFSCVNDLYNKVPGVGASIVEQNWTLLVCEKATPRSRRTSRGGRRTRHDSSTASLSEVVTLSPKPSSSGATPRTGFRQGLRQRSRGNIAPPDLPATSSAADSVASLTPRHDDTSRSAVLDSLSDSHMSEDGGSGEDEEGGSDDEDAVEDDDDDDDDDEDDEEEEEEAWFGDTISDDETPQNNTPSFPFLSSSLPLSIMGSSSTTSTPGPYRSRIPIPISGSFGKHIMKRKCSSSRDELVQGKRMRTTDDVSAFSVLMKTVRHQYKSGHRPRIPSKEHPPAKLSEWLQIFQTWSNAERMMALDELITICEPTQVRHMMQVIEPQFQRDFISLLPKELALYVLSFLEPKALLKAAQTCQYWRLLAEDNLLWREKCRDEGIDENLVYGPNRIRRKRCPWKALYMRQHQIELNWRCVELRQPKLLKGHDDHVITCLEFCGNKVVSGSDDNTLKVWSALTGKCLRTLVGHTGGVWSSQMSGNIVISGSTDRTLKVWNADTGNCIHTLYGHTSTVRCMHLHDNVVVSGSRDATLRMWDIDTGQCLHVLMGHVAAVRCVQYDGRRVVSGAYDYMVKVWDPETETCLHTLQGHTNRVYSLQFDGIHIVSGSLDTSIRVWDVETGNCLHTLIGHQSLTSGLELKDNILVSGNADSTVKVWDITTGQCLQTLQGPNKHQSAVTCLQFNKRFVITSSDDGTVKIWDLKTGEFLRNLVALESGGSGGVVWRVRCSNTKLVCAVGSRNGTEETKLLVLDFDVDDKKISV